MAELKRIFSDKELRAYSAYWLLRPETPLCISCHNTMTQDHDVKIESVDVEGNDFFFCLPCGFRFVRKQPNPNPNPKILRLN